MAEIADYSNVIILVAALGVIFVGLTVYIMFWTRKEKAVSGREGLAGETGVASTDIHTEGSALVHGEWWNARSDEFIAKGERIKVVEAKGMMLKVEKLK